MGTADGDTHVEIRCLLLSLNYVVTSLRRDRCNQLADSSVLHQQLPEPASSPCIWFHQKACDFDGAEGRFPEITHPSKSCLSKLVRCKSFRSHLVSVPPLTPSHSGSKRCFSRPLVTGNGFPPGSCLTFIGHSAIGCDLRSDQDPSNGCVGA